MRRCNVFVQRRARCGTGEQLIERTEHLTEQGEQVSKQNRTALRLADAAARLGITPNALRMRFRRGKADGFRRDGRIFIYLANTEQPTEQRTEQTEQGSELSEQTLDAIIELQRVELNRLLTENNRLNNRVDDLVQIQQREQVLRQQLQNNVERLTDQVAAIPPPEHVERNTQMLENRLQRSESNYSQLMRALMALMSFLEGKKA